MDPGFSKDGVRMSQETRKAVYDTAKVFLDTRDLEHKETRDQAWRAWQMAIARHQVAVFEEEESFAGGSGGVDE